MTSRQWLWFVVGLLAFGGVVLPPFQHGVLRAVVFVAAFLVLTLVREAVRLLLGTVVGLRAVGVEVGEGGTLYRRRITGVLWHVKRVPIASATIWTPPAETEALRARMALLLIARPAVNLAVLLGVWALGVPLTGDAGHAWALQSVAAASGAMLMLAMVPFSIRTGGSIPFESDGLALLRLPSQSREELQQPFGRYYAARALEALKDGDPSAALAVCEEGLRRHGPPWSHVFRNIESIARSRAGDHASAQAEAERALEQDLPPVARAVALNNWCWYAFLRRDEADLRLAARRSEDALTLQPSLASIVGTRGAILLWQGRVTEALALLERGHREAPDPRGRAIDACLLALAHAARGESARAQAYLDEVKRPDETDGLWGEAELRVRGAQEPTLSLRAAAGGRSLVVRGDHVELVERTGVARSVAPDQIDDLWVARTARGRALLIVRSEGRRWRLPLDAAGLAWARMLVGGAVIGAAGGADAGPPAGDAALERSIAEQERAYQEISTASRLAVSSPKGVLFLVSAVAFAASMLVFTSWQWLGVIMPVLLLHELGHWVAMRAFGHHDARISFVPFMGAATFTKIPFEKRWQEIVMLLAGPVPGLVLGVAVLMSRLSHFPQLTTLAPMLIGINAINLLPLHPLDGGRIMHALVTAGRPRLDLALRTAAGLVFLGGGLAIRDPLLIVLGGFGLLFWKRARQATALETSIRRLPGFDPRLPPAARRAFIFRALAKDRQKSADWAATVASLEASLAHRRPPAWQTALWVGSFAACVLAIGLVSLKVSRTVGQYRCPSREKARPISCATAPAFGDVDWSVPSTAPPMKRTTAHAGEDDLHAGRFSAGAFVWCTLGDATAAHALEDQLSEARTLQPYCAAFPWEHLATGTAAASPSVLEERRKARWTFASLSKAILWHKDALIRFDKRAEEARRSPDFDPEVARLLRERIVHPDEGRDDDDDDRGTALADRLGRSPTDSCDRIVVTMAPRADADADTATDTRRTLRLSVRLATPADFSALGTYLCEAGCRLEILPAQPADRRLAGCF